MHSLKSNKVGEFGKFVQSRWSILSQSRKDSPAYSEFMIESFNSNAVDAKGIMQPSSLSKSGGNCNWKNKDVMKPIGIQIFLGGESIQNFSGQTSNKVNMYHKRCSMLPSSVRTLASTSASESSRRTTKEEKRKDISTVEDPFDAPTYNIPEKPVTFTEGASYTVIILAGLGVAAAAAYAVFKELIFEPREYKIFNKSLARVQNDSQVRVRIGSPVTGYGQESRNRAARQRIPNRTWTDEDGVEHVEVNFYIRGPHGAGKVYCEMFKDKVDKQWKFMYLVVEIKSPSPAQLMLESYIPA